MPEAATAAPPASGAQSTSDQSLDPNAGLGAEIQVDSGTTASTASSASESWAKGWIKPDGTFDHSAFDKAPDDLKGVRKELERYKTPDEMAKGWRERESFLAKKGAHLLDPLPKDATPEAKAERASMLRKATGAPDKPEGYVLAKPEGIPDNMWNTAAVKQAADIAFKNGVSNEALKEFADLQLNLGKQAMESQKMAEKEWFDGQDKLIRDAAGKEGLDYAKARDYADRAAQRWGVAKDSPLLKNATVFMLLSRLGKAQAEGQFVQGDTSDAGLMNLTPDTALKAAEAIRDNRENAEWSAYWNRDPKTNKEINHPDHDKIVAKVKKLTSIAYKDRPQRK